MVRAVMHATHLYSVPKGLHNYKINVEIIYEKYI